MYYSKRDKAFDVLNAILGFQQVKNNADYCLVWMKQMVHKPNRKFPTTVWAKTLMKREDVMKHFKTPLKNLKIDSLYMLDSEFCTKWITTEGESKNFIKAIIPFPTSELTGRVFNVQINQYSNDIPESVKERALIEGLTNEDQKQILIEYTKKSRAHTYWGYGNEKKLVPLFTLGSKMKYPIYEEKIIVEGEANHTILNSIGIDTSDFPYRLDSSIMKLDAITKYFGKAAVEEDSRFALRSIFGTKWKDNDYRNSR